MLCLYPHYRFNKTSGTAVLGMGEEDKVIFLCQVKVIWRDLIFFMLFFNFLYFVQLILFCTAAVVIVFKCECALGHQQKMFYLLVWDFGLDWVFSFHLI